MRMRIKPMTANFIPPVYKTEGAAAFDIFLQHDLTLTPHKPVTFGLGFGADMDEGYSAELLPRSGVGRKYGVRLLNTIGLIDYDFKGEWAVTLDCDTSCSFKRGDRILQCVIRWAARATDIEVETNKRGLESGSTGV